MVKQAYAESRQITYTHTFKNIQKHRQYDTTWTFM